MVFNLMHFLFLEESDGGGGVISPILYIDYLRNELEQSGVGRSVLLLLGGYCTFASSLGPPTC